MLEALLPPRLVVGLAGELGDARLLLQAQTALGSYAEPGWAQAEGWPVSDEVPRAGVSSFGIGGTNCFIVPGPAPAPMAGPPAPPPPVLA